MGPGNPWRTPPAKNITKHSEHEKMKRLGADTFSCGARERELGPPSDWPVAREASAVAC